MGAAASIQPGERALPLWREAADHQTGVARVFFAADESSLDQPIENAGHVGDMHAQILGQHADPRALRMPEEHHHFELWHGYIKAHPGLRVGYRDQADNRIELLAPLLGCVGRCAHGWRAGGLGHGVPRAAAYW